MESILNKRILLVEDDLRLSQLIRDFLCQHDFVVDCLAHPKQLSSYLTKHAPDIVLLDIMLPGEDGFSLCKSLRKKFHGPLLFLTAKSSDFDQVLGLELGADDYIIKPVEPRVLLARIHAVIRRSENSATLSADTPNTLQYGQLFIDRQARRVTLAGEIISLTSHEFDMLWMLASHPATLVERDTLYTQLIGREYDGLDRSADVRISRIRKKLHDNPQNPFRIKTIWGKGFYFVPDAWQ